MPHWRFLRERQQRARAVRRRPREAAAPQLPAAEDETRSLRSDGRRAGRAARDAAWLAATGASLKRFDNGKGHVPPLGSGVDDQRA